MAARNFSRVRVLNQDQISITISRFVITFCLDLVWIVSTLFSVCPFVEYFSAQSLNTVPMKYSLLNELIKFNCFIKNSLYFGEH